MLCPQAPWLEGKKGQLHVSLKAQVLQRELERNEDLPFATLDQQGPREWEQGHCCSSDIHPVVLTICQSLGRISINHHSHRQLRDGRRRPPATPKAEEVTISSCMSFVTRHGAKTHLMMFQELIHFPVFTFHYWYYFYTAVVYQNLSVNTW